MGSWRPLLLALDAAGAFSCLWQPDAEALRNFRRLLKASSASEPGASRSHGSPRIDPTESDLVDTLQTWGFGAALPSSSLQADQGPRPLVASLGNGRFERWAPGRVGIATAGTATEQLVARETSSVTSGPGPQFTLGFAQRRPSPWRCRSGLREQPSCLSNWQRCSRTVQVLGQRGRQRMGSPGGSEAIARAVIRALTLEVDTGI